MTTTQATTAATADWRTEIQRREGESLIGWSLRRGHILGRHDGLRIPAAIDCAECPDCLLAQRES